jgi:hypothetical protein
MSIQLKYLDLMNKIAQSIFIFGLYMLGEGAILLLFPNLLLNLIDMPQTSEVWIRVAGLALCVLGYYYVRAARINLKEFFVWTVHMRLIQFVVIAGLVGFSIGPPAILMFSGVELASGVWTWLVLKKYEKVA